ncbi:AraD1 family protein [Aurantiacibacter suaedae]|uniref:AraD1 family protein n=1 Tax=Aurantiacibacter suaedae TaxID=2545755 RepID=UPI0010FA53AD|nr:AraD1 family protein [Aurantiacibacter suaedae]
MVTQARLLQYRGKAGERRVILAQDDAPRFVEGAKTTRELAGMAATQGQTLLELARSSLSDEVADIEQLFADGQLLAAIDHPDDARILLTGTGLTHLGSAEGRDKMHRQLSEAEQLTDSMRMFQEGLEGGKPPAGQFGQQPEWFYKGDGQSLVGPRDPLISPHFAQDGSEEPELAGIYLIGDNGQPFRLGIALANEFSDHVTERHNYLWLAHSKLRPAAIGAELLLGDAPTDIRGTSRILRAGKCIWEKPFLTGEDNMSHTIANLEAHHFKYAAFRRPGDIHVHFFGTATLSFSDDIRTQEGDVFEIGASPFALPLRNELKQDRASWQELRVL